MAWQITLAAAALLKALHCLRSRGRKAETLPLAFLIHIHTYGGQQGSHKAINYLYCLSGPNPTGLDWNSKLQ